MANINGRAVTRRLVAVAAIALTLLGVAGAATPPPTSLRIMTIGDSLNSGLGSPDGCGYRTELARLMQTAGPGGTPVAVTWTGALSGSAPNDCKLPYGHHGTTVQDLRDNINAWMASDTPDVVLIQIGTNNAAGTPPGLANFQADYQDLVQRIFAASPTAKVVFSYIPYSVASWATNEVSANVSIIYASWTLAGPYAGRFVLINSSLLPCKFLSDGIHPYFYDPIARWYYDGLVALYGFTPLPVNSYYFVGQPRPGYERSPSVCPA